MPSKGLACAQCHEVQVGAALTGVPPRPAPLLVPFKVPAHAHAQCQTMDTFALLLCSGAASWLSLTLSYGYLCRLVRRLLLLGVLGMFTSRRCVAP